SVSLIESCFARKCFERFQPQCLIFKWITHIGVLLCFYDQPALIAVLGCDLEYWYKIHAAFLIARNRENAAAHTFQKGQALIAYFSSNRRAHVLRMNVANATHMVLCNTFRIAAAKQAMPCIKQQLGVWPGMFHQKIDLI